MKIVLYFITIARFFRFNVNKMLTLRYGGEYFYEYFRRIEAKRMLLTMNFKQLDNVTLSLYFVAT